MPTLLTPGATLKVHRPGMTMRLWLKQGPKGDTGEDGEDGADGVVQSIVPGNNIDVDNSDPANPVVSVEALTAGDIDGLAPVAATGAYSDLTGKPTLGTAAAKNVGAASGDVAAGNRGLPTGGSSGQTLVKASGTDYDVGWTTPSAASGAPLAVVTRTATAAATYATSSATNADVDATNLAITFTVPASGNVTIFLNGLVDEAAGSVCIWSLRTGSTNVVGSARTVCNNFTGKVWVRVPIRLTGLTPGASVTYKWAWRDPSAGTSTLYYGNSSSEFAGTNPTGPLVMEVYAA